VVVPWRLRLKNINISQEESTNTLGDRMLILNWNLIISNAITAAISGMFTAIGVYLAMKMIKHAEGNEVKAEIKKDVEAEIKKEEKKEANQDGVSLP